jgi:NAD(P)-dependent dehydrogenase (short-subunit alcohol dehydrogenase family)
VDVVAPAVSEVSVDARYIYADLKDYGTVLALLAEVDDKYRGIDAVIHIAAIPAPSKAVSLLQNLESKTDQQV